MSIPHLRSDAQIVAVAFGAATGGHKQESPAFLQQLAENETVEILHYDPAFAREGSSACAISKEWEKQHEGADFRVFRSKRTPSFQVTLINHTLPQADEKEARQQFEAFCREKLEQGKTIFLAVHSQCYEDTTSMMSSLQNTFWERYPNKIHLYIQCANQLAFVYSKRHRNMMGKFALYALETDYNKCFKPNWGSFVGAFSSGKPFQFTVNKTRALMQQFQRDVDADTVLTASEKREAPEVRGYLDDPEHYQLRVLPINSITPATFGIGAPGPRKCACTAGQMALTAAAVAVVWGVRSYL